MAKQQVEALKSFDHGGRRKKGSRFFVPHTSARELQESGLVRIIPANPTKRAAGNPSSVSPAAQASTKRTRKKLGFGARNDPASGA